eukprot:TRINITY_DN5995_c0_g1_i1.p1 TRINITY_DN5995_c0_g1~~TRINITY_DN5995_c0_g1_i1.p1  ORF type:complete len:369 (+),score=112.62 TRINITY_DN5995_c0_g1_i1:22-1107(+)
MSENKEEEAPPATRKLSFHDIPDLTFLDKLDEAEDLKDIKGLQGLCDKTNDIIKMLKEDADLLLAVKCRSKVEAFLKALIADENLKSEEIKNFASAQLELFQTDEDHVELTRRIEIVLNLQKIIFESENWPIVSEANGAKIQYEPSPDGTGLHNFKVTANVKASMFNVMAVIYEVDFYKNWIPLLKFAKDFAILEKFQKIAHLELFGAWPVLSNRDLLVEGFGCIFDHDDALLAVLQSVQSNPKVPNLPQADGYYVVRAEFKVGAFYVKYISEEETQIYMIINMDPKMPFFPDWVLNMATGQVLGWMFYYLEKSAHFDESSPYTERIRNNPGVYDHVKKVVDRKAKAATARNSPTVNPMQE